ncbi:DUF1934 domain-containing protein [Clostridium aminobutyricum]|uniref:DUF1934 domain-containing protein n=1 Tax=Clostridium aminobutyricum TaxID=33953 RepID=A0A939IGX6_CLOAM|nr:DUF1934 domain-containing protein [Clostridium aminobutyricum]MBN7774115.1 DUF1934 domain-containing protein [Clostridium aminobutyricum]
MLKIRGKQISADSEEDQIEFVTEGKIYERNQAVYVVYDESEVSGMPGCKTSLKLKGDTIRMRRFGESVILDTAIEFQKGRRYEGFYDTPFGAIEMEVLTNDLVHNLTPEGKGSIDIDYHISLKGLSEGRSKLNIQII